MKETGLNVPPKTSEASPDAAALCTVTVWRKERETESVRAFIAACGKPAKID